MPEDGLVTRWRREIDAVRPMTTDRLQKITENLLQGPPSLTMAEFAERAGVSMDLARTFWRGMGFRNVPDDVPNFTKSDVTAMRAWAANINSGFIDESALVSLLRAQSHTMDRLALWQVETMVDNIQRHSGLDDTDARSVVLSYLDESDGFTSKQITYAWRRHMADLAERIFAEISARPARVEKDGLPLPRALGFVDMVAFTTHSRQLGAGDLARLVEGFELTARDVITANGARVVKTVGDAVLYIADDTLTGAQVCLAMIEAIGSQPDLLPVRASLVWGHVVSRSGDVFGPVVNLASRLLAVTPPNSLFTDSSTAALLAVSPRAADFLMFSQPPVNLPGIGELAPVELRWANNAQRHDVWLPHDGRALS